MNNDLLINEIKSENLENPRRNQEQLVASLVPFYLTEMNVSGHEFNELFKENKNIIKIAIEETLGTFVDTEHISNGISHYYYFYPKDNDGTLAIYAAKPIYILNKETVKEDPLNYKARLIVHQPKINFNLIRNIVNNPNYFLLEKKQSSDNIKIQLSKKPIWGGLELISESYDLLNKIGISPKKFCKYDTINTNKTYNVETNEFRINFKN